MTPADARRLAAHVGLSVKELKDGYAEEVGGRLRLRAGADGYCVFRNASVTGGCSVHPAKPSVCRAWPFFRGNLLDEGSWDMSRDYCPGIVKEAGHAVFRREGLAYLQGEVLPQAGLEEGEVPGALNIQGLGGE